MTRWAIMMGLAACMLASAGCKDNQADQSKYDANIDGKSATRIDPPPADLTLDQAEVSKKFEHAAVAAPAPAPASAPASGPAIEAPASTKPADANAAEAPKPADANAK